MNRKNKGNLILGLLVAITIFTGILSFATNKESDSGINYSYLSKKTNYADYSNVDTYDIIQGLKDSNVKILIDWGSYNLNYKSEDNFLISTLNKTLNRSVNYVLNPTNLKYVTDASGRLLDVCRKGKDKITDLAFVYRYVDTLNLDLSSIDKSKSLKELWDRDLSIEDKLKLIKVHRDEFADCALNEMINLAGFKDWGLAQLLDISEMIEGFSIGYNWLDDYLDKVNQKDFIRQAIINKGLIYFNHGKYEEAFYKTNNWNNVCNGGFLNGALAIYNDLRDGEGITKSACAYIITRSIKNTPLTLNDNYNGVYSEGVGYWGYGMSYLVEMLSTLDNTFKSDFGLLDYTYKGSKVIKDLCYYPLNMTGTSGKPFNYSDSTESSTWNHQSAWLAEKYKDSYISDVLYTMNRQDPYTLLWYNETYCKDASKDNSSERKYTVLNGFVDSMAVFKNDTKVHSNEIYSVLKGGSNQSKHGDLDIGSFVFDALGVRWAKDLGMGSYNSYNYFGLDNNAPRWKLYEKRAEGHNTLSINPGTGYEDQNVYANCLIDKYDMKSDEPYAILDMTSAYLREAVSVKRGMKLVDNKNQMLLVDEIECRKALDIYWSMQTNAEITIDKDNSKIAHLVDYDSSGNKQQLDLKILGDDDLEFSIMSQTFFSTNGMNTKDSIYQYRTDYLGKPIINESGLKQQASKLVIKSTGSKSKTIKVLFSPKYSDRILNKYNDNDDLEDWYNGNKESTNIKYFHINGLSDVDDINNLLVDFDGELNLTYDSDFDGATYSIFETMLDDKSKSIGDYTLVKDYSSDKSAIWKPSKTGTYELILKVKKEDIITEKRITGIKISNQPKAPTLTISKDTDVLAGEEVKFTIGDDPDVDCKLVVRSPVGTYTVYKDYSKGNEIDYKIAGIGDWKFIGYVRDDRGIVSPGSNNINISVKDTKPSNGIGSVTISYLLDGTREAVSLSDKFNDLKYGNYTYKAKDIEGYELVDFDEKSVNLEDYNDNPEIKFFYKKVQETVTPSLETDTSSTQDIMNESSTTTSGVLPKTGALPKNNLNLICLCIIGLLGVFYVMNKNR